MTADIQTALSAKDWDELDARLGAIDGLDLDALRRRLQRDPLAAAVVIHPRLHGDTSTPSLRAQSAHGTRAPKQSEARACRDLHALVQPMLAAALSRPVPNDGSFISTSTSSAPRDSGPIPRPHVPSSRR